MFDTIRHISPLIEYNVAYHKDKEGFACAVSVVDADVEEVAASVGYFN